MVNLISTILDNCFSWLSDFFLLIICCTYESSYFSFAFIINNSKYLSRVIVSNSIPQDMNCKKCSKLEVFDVSSLLSEVLKRIMTGDSLSELF